MSRAAGGPPSQQGVQLDVSEITRKPSLLPKENGLFHLESKHFWVNRTKWVRKLPSIKISINIDQRSPIYKILNCLPGLKVVVK